MLKCNITAVYTQNNMMSILFNRLQLKENCNNYCVRCFPINAIYVLSYSYRLLRDIHSLDVANLWNCPATVKILWAEYIQQLSNTRYISPTFHRCMWSNLKLVTCCMQWTLLLWTLENKYTRIIHTLSYGLKVVLQYVNWPGKSGHLDNQDTFGWSQGVHIYIQN